MKRQVFTLFILISLFVSSSCNSKKSKFDLLQGTWILTDDPKSELKIAGNLRTDFYEGKDVGGDMFVLSNECTEDKNTDNIPDGSYLIAFSDETIYCYYIVSLDDKKMELQFQGRGGALVYTKK
jgi:hypothetical protein